MPKNKNKKKSDPQQEARDQKQKQQTTQPHTHNHQNCSEHDHEQTNHHHAKQLPDLDLFSSFQQFMPTINATDPLPDFTAFDQSKDLIHNMIQDFQKALTLIAEKKYDALDKVTQQEDKRPQPKKLSKPLQEQKDRTLKDLKSNQEVLERTQKKLKMYGDNPKLQNLKQEILVGWQCLGQDVKDTQAHYKLIEQSY